MKSNKKPNKQKQIKPAPNKGSGPANQPAKMPSVADMKAFSMQFDKRQWDLLTTSHDFILAVTTNLPKAIEIAKTRFKIDCK